MTAPVLRNDTLVTIVEDRPDKENFKRQLKKEFKGYPGDVDVRTTSSLRGVKNTFKKKTDVRVFIVDINLGLGKEDEGVNIIKSIRKEYENDLIIAYSAHTNTKGECIAAGASLFLSKSATTYEQDLQQIVRLVRASYISNPQQILKLFAQIDAVEEEFVLLNCLISPPGSSKKMFQRKKYLKKMFLNFEENELYVGAPVQIETFLSEKGDLIYSVSKPRDEDFPKDFLPDEEDLSSSPLNEFK